jgi:hypothetical protein
VSDLFFGEFSTDITPPAVTAHSPTGVGVARDTDIVIDLWDDELGVDTASIGVTVNGVAAVLGGVFQAGFSGSITDIGGGTWRVTINPATDLPNYVSIPVKVNAQDLAPLPNVMAEFSWSFQTEDSVNPTIFANTPTGIDVPVGSWIEFKATDDGSGIDLVNTVVEVNGVTVYDWDGTGSPDDGFQAGWDAASYITVLTAPPESFPGYKFWIKKNGNLADLTPFLVSVQTQDVAGNPASLSWSFTTEDSTAPIITGVAPTGANVLLDRVVEFNLIDTGSGIDLATLDVVIESVPAVVNGVAQPGFGLTPTAIVNGWHCEVTHPDFTAAATVACSIYIEDYSGLSASYPWSFTTSLGPLLSVKDFGFLRGYTSTIGEMLGGIRATRLTDPEVAGATTLRVETTLDWPAAGKVGIDGIAYRYTGKTPITLTGIYYLDNGAVIPGIRQLHKAGAGVLDLSKSWSRLDQLRRAFLVEYAGDSDLDAVGRNLGINRAAGVGDDDFRKIIKTLAYAPRGTIWSIEQLLTELLGVGNFEIVEDLINNPCLVKILLPQSLMVSASPVGKSYLEGGEMAPATADDAITVADTPLGVGGVRWKDELVDTDCRSAKPSADYEIEYPTQTPPGTQLWAFQGANEATEVTQLPGQWTEIQSVGPAYYRHLARIQPESEACCSMVMQIPLAGTLDPSNRRQICLAMHDTERAIALGVAHIDATHYSLGFIDVFTGAAIGTQLTALRGSAFFEVGFKKTARGKVRLVLNGWEVSILDRDYTAFPTTTDHKVEFGNLAAALPAAPILDVKAVYFGAKTLTDYWATRGSAGVTQYTWPTRFDTGIPGSFNASLDVGKTFEVQGSVVANADGGNANGSFRIAEVVSNQVVRVEGILRHGATVNSANPLRVVLDRPGLRFPDDLGKVLQLSGSSLGNNGSWTITKLLKPGTLLDMATMATQVPEETNICEVFGASFASEPDLDWQVHPAFENETGLDWVLSHAGSFAGTALTLRNPLPITTLSYLRVLAVKATQVYSAQLLRDPTVQNTPEVPSGWDYYPLYLAKPWHFLIYYLDQLTVAGVICEVEFV